MRHELCSCATTISFTAFSLVNNQMALLRTSQVSGQKAALWLLGRVWKGPLKSFALKEAFSKLSQFKVIRLCPFLSIYQIGQMVWKTFWASFGLRPDWVLFGLWPFLQDKRHRRQNLDQGYNSSMVIILLLYSFNLTIATESLRGGCTIGVKWLEYHD